MKLLLSIKPEFAARIFDGEKTFEFRKAVHQQPGVRTAAVYVTRPVGMIVGEFEIEEILCETPEVLWQLTQHGAGISREFFFSYFDKRNVAYALRIGKIRKFERPIAPKSLIEDFTAPQSYMYVNDQLGRPEQEIEPYLPLLKWPEQLSA